MSPVLSKLILRASAAGVGSAVVPAAPILQRHLAPYRAAFHQAVRSPFGDVAAVYPDCLPSLSGEPTAPRIRAVINTLVLFGFVIASSAILDLSDSLTRGGHYLKDLLDRGIAIMRNS